MARKRDAAYGAPQEEKEVVVSVDRRLLIGVGLALLCVLALGAGFLWAGRGAPSATMSAATSGPEATAAAQAQADALATQTIKNEMAALSLPESAQVVESIVRSTDVAPAVATAVPGAAAVPGDGRNLPPEAATMAADLGGDLVDFPEDRPDATGWEWDVLANYEDPNVTQPGYEPARTEEVKQPLEGPRLGISDLNFLNTFAYGKVPMDIPAAHDFMMTNVGDADLVVGRIYTGCGCTATRLGDIYLDNAGFLPTPATLKPGESKPFTIEFDPRSEGKAGSQAKFIQIFTNDPTKTQFTPGDPNSHEARFRIVVQPAYEIKSPEGATTFKVATFGGNSPAATPEKR
jgi:hypothetical protein